MFDNSTIQRFLLTRARTPALYEVEARLGRFDDSGKSFTSGVAYEDFSRMIKFHQKEMRSETSVVTQRFVGQMRHEKDKVVKKESMDRLDLNDYDVRISLSRETVQHHASVNEYSILRLTSLTRVKRRTSFIVSHELRLDFTEVTTTQGDSLDGPLVTYEVELEVVNDITVLAFQSALENLIRYWKLTNFILSKPRINSLEKSFSNLVGVNNIRSFAGAQPRTMQLNDFALLESQPYAFTYKIDGIRTYLFITNRGTVLLVTPGSTTTMKQIAAIESTEFDGTVLDGEFSQKYYTFDTIFWKGRDLRDDPEYRCLLKRMSFLDILVERVPLIIKKDYHVGNSFEELSLGLKTSISRALNGALASLIPDEDLDGIILTPVNECYPRSKSWKGLLKWKPKVTIDFRVVRNHLFVGARPMEVEFKPENTPHAGVMLPFFNTTTVKCKDGDIYECQWDANVKSFVPSKHRGDKLHPNYITIALDNFHAINNPVTLPMLTGEEYAPIGQTVTRTEKYMVSITDAAEIIKAPKKSTGESEILEYPLCEAEPSLEIPIQLPVFDTTYIAEKSAEDNVDETEPSTPEQGDVEMEDVCEERPATEDSACDSSESEEDSDNTPARTRQAVKQNSPKKIIKRRRSSKPVVLLLGTPLKQWRVVDLKAACAERQLKTKVKKTTLIEQLQEWECNN